MRILLVEDDRMIGEAVRDSLRAEAYVVDWMQNGSGVDAALAAGHVDLVLLDLGLPGVDGLQILRRLRARPAPEGATPVIVITARDAIESRIAGLDAGADDYLVKPFDVDELAARIRSALRRSSGRAAPDIVLGGVRIRPATREVERDGAPVLLSAREYAIVEALAARPGAILSRAQLEERMYGWGDEVESNAVEVHIHAVRKKLGTDFIRNVRGVGYFVPKPEGA
ncbi:response regulator [Noviherbaspirillum pedocola]|uniref:Response regulator transcription factor n=1 Tax=Noviherbaspirillum pedocola TaxID=2801341 RepID=A0A934W7H0_9BURK|nr:response regulator transcription factor [Noviherbaspirillum pedocola]MBK4735568.1 response regulator transcription factor [Noviherbaspirillum pedocola]